MESSRLSSRLAVNETRARRLALSPRRLLSGAHWLVFGDIVADEPSTTDSRADRSMPAQLEEAEASTAWRAVQLGQFGSAQIELPTMVPA